MSVEVKHTIKEFLRESTHFNTNDVLVHAEKSNKKLFATSDLLIDNSDFPSIILRDAKKMDKESGVNTLARSSGIVSFQYEKKTVKTPIFIHSLEFKELRLKNQIEFKIQEEEWFINPFLENFIAHDLKIGIPDFEDINAVFTFLISIGLTELDRGDCFIGNFHHHRFQIIKELEELMECNELHPNVSSLLGEGKGSTFAIKSSTSRLLPSDIDHEKVFENLVKGNCVVQGPPGTGKSQVLTNVIGTILKNNATTIIVSEKRVALEVLVKKLSAFNLDKLCFIATSDKLSHSFLQELKSTWDYFDSLESANSTNLGWSKQYEDHLQMTLDLLHQKDLIGGLSFTTFNQISQRFNGWEKATFSSRVPSLSTALENEAVLQDIFDRKLNQILAFIQPQILQDDSFLSLDVKIDCWLKLVNELNKEIPFSTMNELRNIMKLAVNCQVYENEFYKKYSSIFSSNSLPQKKFLRLRKKYLKRKEELLKINQNQSHWKIIPSEVESRHLIDVIKLGKFFSLRKAKKRWNELSTVSFNTASLILENHLVELQIINDFSKITIEFCEIGLGNPELEVPSIYQTLTQFSSDQWMELEKIPAAKRDQLTEYHQDIQGLFSDFRSYFSLENETNIPLFLENIKGAFDEIILLRKSLDFADLVFLQSLKNHSSFDAYFQTIFKSHWIQFKERFPVFADFKMSELNLKIESVIQQENIESFQLSNEIEIQIKKRFDSYHLLLQTPARKLTEEDKKMKSILRKGKSILIKEFSKTRSHPSLRHLYNSEARLWIQLLKPIWLSNPTQLAKCFPLEKGLFDLAIFDEASQIPIQNALGTVQRSKQLLIAGDEHQMGPTSYFQKGENEVIDLLHQANYHFSKTPLHHHYRSAHPDLIAFSNKHFYGNDLKVYPSNDLKSPLHHHFVEDGIFVNRKNENEAKQIALKIETLMTSYGSIGVVAFSEEQLNCIWEELSNDTKVKFQQKLENNRGFFKSLENVQGDECDHLLISFGYGKNEDGEFHLRFGPMNTFNGRKRLNVLLTRAIQSIHFYCSVRSADFKLSDNESVHLLKQWIAFSENYNEKEAIDFPFGLHPIIQENQLELKNIHENITEARELVTLHRVFSERGWQVVYS